MLPSFAIHVFTHAMREADELFEINSKLLLEFLEVSSIYHFHLRFLHYHSNNFNYFKH